MCPLEYRFVLTLRMAFVHCNMNTECEGERQVVEKMDMPLSFIHTRAPVTVH